MKLNIRERLRELKKLSVSFWRTENVHFATSRPSSYPERKKIKRSELHRGRAMTERALESLQKTLTFNTPLA